MWYRWSQEQVDESEKELGPSKWGISAPQVEDMIRRVKGESGQYYRDRDVAWKDVTDNDIALEAANNYEIYNRFLSKLPENVDASDLLKAYRAGLLPQYITPPAKTPPLDVTNAPEIEDKLLWSPKKTEPLAANSLEYIYALANSRMIPSNKDKVSDARYQLLLETFKDPQLSSKLGIKQSELNKLLRRWSNMPARSLQLEQMVNQGQNVTTEWTGISNSSIVAMSQVSADDIDDFFDNIEVGEYAQGWYGKSGVELRNGILRTIMAIDSHQNYGDLSFKIIDIIVNPRSKDPRGQYLSSKKLIEIKSTYRETIAHEIGHYLDDKWAQDLLGTNIHTLSTSTPNISMIKDPEVQQFLQIFKEFIMDISERSNVSSEYMQSRNEVFARFIAQFVHWVNLKSGTYEMAEDYYGDHFTENQFLRFVKILQMKSYLDAQKREHFLDPANLDQWGTRTDNLADYVDARKKQVNV